MKVRYMVLFLPFILSSCFTVNRPKEVKVEADSLLSRIALPKGFQIDYYAKDLVNARAMAWGDRGTLFIGSFEEGKVYASVDTDGDLYAEKNYVLCEGLNTPNGVAFNNGDLYIAEINRILVLRDIENNLENPPAYEVVYDEFPDKFHHGWKYIAFGPDDMLYIPVGAPCNICENEEEIYASITRLDVESKEVEVYAHGIRCSVGLTWHPETQELWFTDNGRDMMGDNMPADELNRAWELGQHFGFPYCHQGDTLDPEFGNGKDCGDYTPPVQKLGPHVAGLGLKFYGGKMFPEVYEGNIFIAEHGSWNRSEPIGYRISRVELNGNESSGYSVFAEGWLRDGVTMGRPVDLLEMEDGSLLVSDDLAGVVYRISFTN